MRKIWLGLAAVALCTSLVCGSENSPRFSWSNGLDAEGRKCPLWLAQLVVAHRVQSFETGVDLLETMILAELAANPRAQSVLVAIYAHSGTGKTTLIDELKARLKRAGIGVAARGGASSQRDFAQLLLSEELARMMGYERQTVQLFHTAYERKIIRGRPIMRDEDPNVLAETVLGRKIAINVGMVQTGEDLYRFDDIDGPYDLMIVNPASIGMRRTHRD